MPAGVLANDTDVEGQALTAQLVAGPANSSLMLGSNGTFTYTPNANFSGPDSFTYRAFDGIAQSAVTTVSINVTAAPDAPVANADAYAVSEDTTLNVTGTAMLPSVLANDTDAENQVLTAAVVSSPANGTLALNPNGTFTLHPAPQFQRPGFVHLPGE